ncbi:MAG: GrpB family protein [Gammaproteobacteria bacterium]|nr:GrpB family protein [Gammaproteobacteria bacterium]MDE0273791.1 GrpB family protein [Gammaproteobacteria bacterium]
MYYPIVTRLTELRNMAGQFEVVPYSETWPKTFQALKARLEPALGALCRRIEHVGSTSVPGLPAKPVIDIDVVIEEDDQLEDVIERLAAIGYAFEGDKGVPGRYAFASPPGLPDHHLYVCAEDAPELRRHLLFRDYLRRHPEEAAGYGELKRRLAKENPVDRVAYTDGKTGWIERALGMARHETLPTSTR